MKKMITIALAAAMAMSMAVSAFAGAMVPAAQEADEIQPHAGQCMECGRGEMRLYDSNTSDWGFVELIRCQKGYTDHMDEVYERVIRKTYKCTACKAMDHVVMTQEKTTCIAY